MEAPKAATVAQVHQSSTSTAPTNGSKIVLKIILHILYPTNPTATCWHKNQHTEIRGQVFAKHRKWTKCASQSDQLIDKETE